MVVGVFAALGLLTWAMAHSDGTAGLDGAEVDELGFSNPHDESEAVPTSNVSSSGHDVLLDLGELGAGAEGELEVDVALQASQAIERVMGELGEAHAFEREGDVPRVAAWVLESYRDAGASLFEASYLDVLGRAWGCVTADAGWVDVCCVREEESGNSLVEVVRLDAKAWEEALG